MTTEALESPALSRLLDGLNACLPQLPLDVRLERGDVAFSSGFSPTSDSTK